MQCRHHPICPGCPLLDRSYEEQLQIKRDRLDRALARYPHLGLRAPPVRPALRDEGYRHRLKLPVDVGRDHVAAGLYDRRTGKIVDTPDCPVLVEGLRETLQNVLVWLRNKRGVHSIDLRWSDASQAAQLVVACEGASLPGGKRSAEALCKAVPAIVSVAVSEADPEGKRVMGRSPTVLFGEPWIDEAIGSTHYRLLPGSFFQADPQNAAVLHERVKALVGRASTVLDLYAGVGAYALALAPGRERVLAVEEVPQAAESARAMAPPNVEVLTSRVEDLNLREPFDVAVINPARRGSDPDALGRLASLAKRLVYVSCGPEALARDLDILAAHGMKVVAMEAIDLFPQTPEVETIVHLSKGPPLKTWPVQGGRAGGPWLGFPSGAVGRPDEVLVLVIGDPGPKGALMGANFVREGLFAGHALLRLFLRGPLELALGALQRKGHSVAGTDGKTARFFAEKTGLVRPFVHILRAGDAFAPPHGDLTEALDTLADHRPNRDGRPPKPPKSPRGGERDGGPRDGRGGPPRGRPRGR